MFADRTKFTERADRMFPEWFKYPIAHQTVWGEGDKYTTNIPHVYRFFTYSYVATPHSYTLKVK